MASTDGGDRITARYVSGGFLNRRIRRIASLAGVDLRPGLPRSGDWVAAWGHAGTSARAEAVAARRGARILRIEDAFLRSLHPGRSGEPTLGLTIDRRGAWFDSRSPSDLEVLLATDSFEDGSLIAQTRVLMDEWARSGVTKYAATRADLTAPAPGYILVIDQTRGDASITLGNARDTTFREMLLIAREENPGQPILIKTHPETNEGHRPGHYGLEDVVHGATLETRPIAPSILLSGAQKVYTVSSQMGFEAILHGHRPVTFGQPFYSGWGLDDDRNPLDRRHRKLTRTQLFAGCMVLYPHWYDPHRDALCDPVDVVRILQARARAWAEDRAGWSAPGMRLWKRAPLRRFFDGPLDFKDGSDKPRLLWGQAKAPEDRPVTRLEDGFLRSRGLGAELIPPLSLVLDRQGLYYDPTKHSDLEAAVIRAAALPPEALDRARRLRTAIVKNNVTKYNLQGTLPDLPEGPILLVPGQVADDASVRLGTTDVADNAALLAAARAANPDAFIVYKPHPDVEAGLREGAIDATDADLVATRADPLALIARAEAVWTMTSLLGFEALLRETPVTTLGAPFYAGWGLTDDRGKIPARRRAARPSLDALVQAVLIDYPRYFDPVTGSACPPETVVHRLAHGPLPTPGPLNRVLSKAQGALASQAWLWR
ncbi:capsular polysaccharide biosynthesis protein [Jannaschia pohangensis]|uniref:Capsular polysaccharide export protein n=1 Tax=Jannaschia pohangensis TaxID=390807 RepID=A0A1I3MI36_9RHOB|nr:capsular polysaccharide biosynthesis protein [Jannaschia pohangensis]SFI96420.1 capsular polysaccharide export protein [Jannaschia pohangensis]